MNDRSKPYEKYEIVYTLEDYFESIKRFTNDKSLTGKENQQFSNYDKMLNKKRQKEYTTVGTNKRQINHNINNKKFKDFDNPNNYHNSLKNPERSLISYDDL